MAAALDDDFGQIGLAIVEFVEELLVARRFLDWVEVGSLDVFDDREFKRLTVVGLDADDWHLMQSGALRRPPAALSGDDLEHARLTRHRAGEKGLDNAFLLDRGGQLGEFLFAKMPARIAGIGTQKFDRDFSWAARGLQRTLRLSLGPAEEGGETAPEPRPRFFRGFTWFHRQLPISKKVNIAQTRY